MNRLITAKVEPGCVAIHWLGQGGFSFQAHAGDVIVVDPYLSDSANTDGSAARLVDIPIAPRDVSLDYLFLTHDHTDHTDPETAPLIAQANPDALIICPPSSTRHLTKLGVPSRQIQTCPAGQSIEFPNFTAHAVAAEHTEDSVGFVFEFNEDGANANGPVVYITGDTEYNDGLAKSVEEYGPDVLLVPINGKWGNMNAAQAARLTAEIAPAEVIPMHFGMFAVNTVDSSEFLSLLADALGSDTVTKPVVPRHNATHIYRPAEVAGGQHGAHKRRSDRAQKAHSMHEHKDGIRGPDAPGMRGTAPSVPAGLAR
jgi:L-ascorbate 6-phosphate lactonase